MACLSYSKLLCLNVIPVRFGVAVMLFMACLISYMMRVNLSLNIISMVEKPGNDSTNSTTDDKDDDGHDTGPRYNWTSYQQGILLGAYFWGYLLTSIPSGLIAERFGGRGAAGYTLMLSAILTAVTPFATDLDFWALFLVRFALCALGGFTYPSCHNLISRWAPPDEKGKFIASLMGGTFGTVVTWTLSGLLVVHMGWRWAFHIPGIFCCFVCLLWFLLVADTPADQNFIKDEERQYIEKSLEGALSKTKKIPPICSLVTSMPFWSSILLHFGNMWGLYYLVTAAPKFMREALGFKLTAAGSLSSLPYLARLIFAFIFGGIGDYIRRKNILSVTNIRKSFCLFSHVIPGLFLIFLAYFGEDPYACVAIITFSLGFNGAATLTNLQNGQDLAPNYAGTLYGIMNCFGTSSGIFSPMIVAYFTKESSTIENWRYVFLIGSAVYIIPAIFFAFFGSGKIQPWNNSPPKEKDPTDTRL